MTVHEKELSCLRNMVASRDREKAALERKSAALMEEASTARKQKDELSALADAYLRNIKELKTMLTSRDASIVKLHNELTELQACDVMSCDDQQEQIKDLTFHLDAGTSVQQNEGANGDLVTRVSRTRRK